ncbi:MAG: radical SAM protein [Archaeoglobaceae archaeon]
MISLSKIVTGEATVSKRLTYGDDGKIPEGLKKFVAAGKPVVVWNVTRSCNLNCVHCYASTTRDFELSRDDCLRMIDELANFGVPLILFSGGEPLLRDDVFEIAAYAKRKGIKCVLSTNGTLINEDNFEELAVFDYVGVSLDGVGAANDSFRGVRGAFERALKGLLLAREVTLTGIRFTVTRFNYDEVPKVLELARREEIPRFCLYHLVPSGRADFGQDIDNEARRKLLDYLISEAEKDGVEILTVDNPADGVYAYLKLRNDDVLEFLRFRGGDGSGYKLVNIDFIGDVHPNQFWWDYTAGNVLRDELSEIMRDELFLKLKNKVKYLRGKCGVCKFKEYCGGFRVRAHRYGDLWGEDPSCFLRYSEIT